MPDYSPSFVFFTCKCSKAFPWLAVYDRLHRNKIQDAESERGVGLVEQLVSLLWLQQPATWRAEKPLTASEAVAVQMQILMAMGNMFQDAACAFGVSGIQLRSANGLEG
ncbi:hypothetical protein COCCADRAFT_24110 [Bipolaris zeicola 26-R-13]|uniref:Uncharacterized protein n=1 Tax=Cochliobolus carbonum (strain 26-R-13) TaxID=930089 RepID=W6YKD6_COCC2|nr:uncharacterized protein COCCADRAFT_24110 [Bipolaris zeicola 26-R-13]EUC36109.1 hypothetical protein COCCADRAFT_24110 [Bipolaris zeicola 26-R-13]